MASRPFGDGGLFVYPLMEADRMTKPASSLVKYVGVPAGALALIATLTGALDVRYVPRHEFRELEDSVRVNRQHIDASSAKQDRILCYMQADNGERPVSECVR
jgi:TolB-like protein